MSKRRVNIILGVNKSSRCTFSDAHGEIVLLQQKWVKFRLTVDVQCKKVSILQIHLYLLNICSDFANFGQFSKCALLVVCVIKTSRWRYQMFSKADDVWTDVNVCLSTYTLYTPKQYFMQTVFWQFMLIFFYSKKNIMLWNVQTIVHRFNMCWLM